MEKPVSLPEAKGRRIYQMWFRPNEQAGYDGCAAKLKSSTCLVEVCFEAMALDHGIIRSVTVVR